MYNYLIDLTYKKHDNDDIYRSELLNCFNLNKYDDDINSEIEKLYNIVKEHYTQILPHLKNNKKLAFFNISEDYLYFTFLFSWDYFYDNHEFLKSINLNNENYEKTKNNLINKLIILNK